jgi:hypothetical protein
MKKFYILAIILVLTVGVFGTTTVFAKTLPTYLIISANGSAGLADLIKYRQEQGLEVLVKDAKEFREDKDTINPLKILDYLKTNVNKLNIKYLLIVGYHSEIPMITCHPEGDKPGMDYLQATPTDYPYSTPSAVWDKDGDGKLGEWPDEGVCAFEPEIAVGRIPFSEADKVTASCKSIIEFDKLNSFQKSKVLFAGAMLGYKGEIWEGKTLERTDGGDYCEKVWNSSFAVKNFSRYRMYEKEGFMPSPYICEEPVNASTLMDKMNDRYGLVLWTGHGSAESVVRTIWTNNGTKAVPEKGETSQPKLLTVSNVKSKTTKWGIVLAASCSTSDPNTRSNLGATFIASGAAGYIGSSRVSWSPSFWRKLEDGGMDTIFSLFCDYISQPGMTQGMALALAKRDFGQKYFYGDTEDPVGASQMNIYNFNLYGDPAVTLCSQDTKPNIIVDEPSTDANPSGAAKWSGRVTGKIDETNNIQVIPSQRDMNWAVPELVVKNNVWSIEHKIPREIELGKRTWLIKLSSGNDVSYIPLILNITTPAQTELVFRSTPEKIGEKMPFVLTFSNPNKLRIYEYIIKYDPFDVSILSIDHVKKPSSKIEFTDNHFGMVYIHAEGNFTGDLFKLRFKAQNGFDAKPILISSIRLQGLNSENIIIYPKEIRVLKDELAQWRLEADFNNTGTVDDMDLSIMIAKIILSDGNNQRYDLNKDGILNFFDAIEVRKRYTQPLI